MTGDNVRPYNEKETMHIFVKVIYVEAPFLTRR